MGCPCSSRWLGGWTHSLVLLSDSMNYFFISHEAGRKMHREGRGSCRGTEGMDMFKIFGGMYGIFNEQIKL